jgi:TRAP-type C4-dicarboxylate transport system permease small subunit
MAFVLRDAEKIICTIIFVAMTALGFANVVVRYATNYSLASSEELLTNGFLLLTIFGAALAARNGDHLAVTLVHDMAGPRLRRVIVLLATLAAVLLLALSAYYCWQLLMNQMASGTRSYALQLPAWYYTIGLPFGFALILVRYVQHALVALASDGTQAPAHD